MNIDLSFYNIKEKIRELSVGDTKIGGDSSFPFLRENENISKPVLALEIPYNDDNFYPEQLKRIWETKDFYEILAKADKTEADLISVKFNTDERVSLLQEIPEIVETICSITDKTLILRGANNTEIDRKLLPAIADSCIRPSIIAFSDEYNYEDIVPAIIENNHSLVLRTPIDINLAKELNILTTDKGLSPDKILIDPDMGGLGYGLEYGYSIIEKIKQAGFDGDKMLNMPIIAFIGEESYKAKEAKSDKFDKNWGTLEERSTMWEISGTSAMIAAGANIAVVWNPKSIKILKELI